MASASNSASKKRKIDNEHRKFNTDWTYKYLCIEENGLIKCLDCQKTVSCAKEYNIKRHYDTHAENYKKVIGKASRLVLVKQLTDKFTLQKDTFKGFKIIAPTTSAQYLDASYRVSLLLATKGKSFPEAEIVKECAIEMAKALGEGEVANKFKSVSLSHQTVATRVKEIDLQLENTLKDKMANCVYWSAALDESSDICDVSQLSIFVRLIDHNFHVTTELLDIKAMLGRTTGKDIFESFDAVVKNFINDYEKLSSLCTDGAPAMCGKQTGFVGELRNHNIIVPVYHCIIHQEALCGKSARLHPVMKAITKIVNFIRGGARALNHRKFKNFLEEVNAAYPDLTLFCEVRWLSAGDCLKKFFELRTDILNFLESEISVDTTHFEKQLKDPEFISALAVLTDITFNLNILNKQIQGKNHTISGLVSKIDAYKLKLNKIFIPQLKENNLAHFPSCKEVYDHLETDFSQYVYILSDISSEFDKRFKDFQQIHNDIKLLSNPFSVEVDNAPTKLQMELCELKEDFFLASQKVDDQLEFWKK